jgi:hypothetical protein
LDAVHESLNIVRDNLLNKEDSLHAKNKELIRTLGASIMFNVGDLVSWGDELLTPGERTTFAPRSVGPYRILQRYGAGCYKLEMVGNKGQFRIANASQLARYTGKIDHFLPDKDETLIKESDTMFERT